MKLKSTLRRITWLVLLICFFAGCETPQKYHKIFGETMGTYYSITFKGADPSGTKKAIEGLLADFNNSLSTYIKESTISQLNRSEDGIALPENEVYFEAVFARSNALHKMTDGALNTAVAPLVNYWGFGYKGKDQITKIDSAAVDSLLAIVNGSTFKIKNRKGEKFVSKSIPQAALDFSSLAKGDGIDAIAHYFFMTGVEHYLIDIGGEARAQGVNSLDQPWTLAINKPKEDAPVDDLEIILQLNNKSMATSGNYRIFYENEGRKFAHILNPQTGYSALTNLLSASIVADDCMTADGLATAMMVMGLEKAKIFLAKHNYPACLIYDADGDDNLEKYYANGFKEMVVKER